MSRPLVPALCALLAATGAPLAYAAQAPAERQQVGQDQLPVSANAEVTLKAREDADVKVRELWYSRFDGKAWGEWQKHGIAFGRETPITWPAPEGVWRVYIRIEQISGLGMPVPDASTKPSAAFIIDRTAPAVSVTFPGEGAKLRGGQPYTVTWQASDPHLHSAPVSILWSRSTSEEFVPVAENLPNSGSYSWTTPKDMTNAGRLRVVVADKARNAGSAEIGALVIDSVAPRGNILGPAIVASPAVTLSLSATDAGPAGLAQVQLYVSDDDGVSWAKGPARDKEPWNSLEWTAPKDGSFLLALIATDQAGNTGKVPAGKADSMATLLVDSTKPVISLPSPIGIVDAAAGKDTPLRRVYKPGDQVRVDFSIEDANIPETGVEVLFQAEEGAAWQSLAQGLPPRKPFAFALPDVGSTTCRVKVRAVDLAGNVGEIHSAEPFRIDNKVVTGEVEVIFE